MDNLTGKLGLVWLICGGLGLVIVALLLGGLALQHPLEPVLVLHRPVVHPVSLRDRVHGSIPWGWGRAHRLIDALGGARKPVNFNAAVFTLEPNTCLQLRELTGVPPAPTPTNGPEVWFVETAGLKKLRAQLQRNERNQVCYGRISTADGIGASLFTGVSVIANGRTNQVGLATSYFARVGANSSDLFAEISLSEAVTNEIAGASNLSSFVYIKTNADIAVRLQVPKGKGVFLLQTSAERVDRPAGFLLEPL